mgnify:CR=1 FL=1
MQINGITVVADPGLHREESELLVAQELREWDTLRKEIASITLELDELDALPDICQISKTLTLQKKLSAKTAMLMRLTSQLKSDNLYLRGCRKEPLVLSD